MCCIDIYIYVSIYIYIYDIYIYHIYVEILPQNLYRRGGDLASETCIHNKPAPTGANGLTRNTTTVFCSSLDHAELPNSSNSFFLVLFMLDLDFTKFVQFVYHHFQSVPIFSRYFHIFSIYIFPQMFLFHHWFHRFHRFHPPGEGCGGARRVRGFIQDQEDLGVIPR